MQTNRLKLDPERTGFEGWNFCRGLDYCKDMVRSCNNTFTSDLYAQLYMFGIMFPDVTDVSMTFVCLCEGVYVWCGHGCIYIYSHLWHKFIFKSVIFRHLQKLLRWTLKSETLMKKCNKTTQKMKRTTPKHLL